MEIEVTTEKYTAQQLQTTLNGNTQNISLRRVRWQQT